MKFVTDKCLFFLLLFFSLNGFGQDILYGDFIYKMPLEKAKSVLKNNKKKYYDLSLGSKTSYSLRKTSFTTDDNEQLISISLWSRKNLNLGQAENYLKNTRSYLEKLGFQTVYFQENWSKPLLFNKKKPGIRFIDKDKTVLIEIEPRGHIAKGGSYNIYITFFNYQWFMSKVLDSK